jgi:hypothetical protein
MAPGEKLYDSAFSAVACAVIAPGGSADLGQEMVFIPDADLA